MFLYRIFVDDVLDTDFFFSLSQVIGKMKRTPGSAKGAEILGVHVEGPFINTNKKGAHDLKYIKKFDKVRSQILLCNVILIGL